MQPVSTSYPSTIQSERPKGFEIPTTIYAMWLDGFGFTKYSSDYATAKAWYDYMQKRHTQFCTDLVELVADPSRFGHGHWLNFYVDTSSDFGMYGAVVHKTKQASIDKYRAHASNPTWYNLSKPVRFVIKQRIFPGIQRRKEIIPCSQL